MFAVPQFCSFGGSSCWMYSVLELYVPRADFSERAARKLSPALVQSLLVQSRWIVPRSMWVQPIFSRHDWAVRLFRLASVFIILGVVCIDDVHYSVDSSLSTNPNLTHVRSIYSAPSHAFFSTPRSPKASPHLKFPDQHFVFMSPVATTRYKRGSFSPSTFYSRNNISAGTNY